MGRCWTLIGLIWMLAIGASVSSVGWVHICIFTSGALWRVGCHTFLPGIGPNPLPIQPVQMASFLVLGCSPLAGLSVDHWLPLGNAVQDADNAHGQSGAPAMPGNFLTSAKNAPQFVDSP